MHIELTDHLRCPADHDESFLVLLPSEMDGRRVVRGELGCPVCQWSTQWEDAVPDFGDGDPQTGEPPCDAEGLHALLGVEGAGGWVALAGTMASLAHDLAGLLPGVGIIAVNPPLGTAASGGVQILRSAAWPIKAHAMRGVAVGAAESEWREQSLGSVLPGLRAVGSGNVPTASARRELLAEAAGLWVMRCG